MAGKPIQVMQQFIQEVVWFKSRFRMTVPYHFFLRGSVKAYVVKERTCFDYEAPIAKFMPQ